MTPGRGEGRGARRVDMRSPVARVKSKAVQRVQGPRQAGTYCLIRTRPQLNAEKAWDSPIWDNWAAGRAWKP